MKAETSSAEETCRERSIWSSCEAGAKNNSSENAIGEHLEYRGFYHRLGGDANSARQATGALEAFTLDLTTRYCGFGTAWSCVNASQNLSFDERHLPFSLSWRDASGPALRASSGSWLTGSARQTCADARCRWTHDRGKTNHA